MLQEESRYILKKIDKEIKDNKKDAILYGGFFALSLATIVGVGVFSDLALEGTAIVNNLTLATVLYGGIPICSFANLIKSISEITNLKKDKKTEEMMAEMLENINEGKTR